MNQELAFWLAKIPTLPPNPQDQDLLTFLEDFSDLLREMLVVGVDLNTYNEISNIRNEMQANAFPNKYAC